MPEKKYENLVALHDEKNLEIIQSAFDAGRINLEAKKYLNTLYKNSSKWYLEMFYVLGQCFGAPKAAVYPYDYEAASAIDTNIKISDINPTSAYIAYHRLDTDPMRNQFFNLNSDGSNIELSVSPIVSVIIGAQKKLERALDKITGKYYNDYVNQIVAVSRQCLIDAESDINPDGLERLIRNRFAKEYITNASEIVLEFLGDGCKGLAANFVRGLDKIEKPHLRLKDVWRVKCLFDLIPQIRNFIENVTEMWPYKILDSRDGFFNVHQPRNYRDAKIVLDIGSDGIIVPMEIICQVRTLFDADNKTHKHYENIRDNAKKNDISNKSTNDVIAEILTGGVREYNATIYSCLEELFERVGWNIIYKHGGLTSLFEGFPRIDRLYHSSKITDVILDKIRDAVRNEVLKIKTSARELSAAEEIKIFDWMTRFILVSAMPYKFKGWNAPTDTVAGKLFTFVMKELERYYNDSK